MRNFNTVSPYTYLLQHKATGKRYYGSRCQNFTKYNRTPLEDFKHHYTTSSNYINEIITAEGIDAFTWELRQTFNTVEEMSAWEKKFLTRCNVLERDDWFNRNIAGYIPPTEESCKKISDFHKNKPKSEEHKRNLSKSQKGKPKNYVQTEEHKRKNSEANSGVNNPMYGPCTEERAANISKAKKGKPAKNKGVAMTEKQKEEIRKTIEKNKVVCEHCGKRVSRSGYTRFHGDNCKYRT